MNAPAVELGLPPLGLYVHMPWCVRKCPYCDFNSHALRGDLPADDYVAALLDDLEQDLPLAWGRTVSSIYFGGGTPSLFPAAAMDRLISGIRARLPLAPDVEITLEANPGTIERDSFTAYAQAGINRVSLGAQTFDAGLLPGIGRIHGRDDIDTSLASLGRSGIRRRIPSRLDPDRGSAPVHQPSAVSVRVSRSRVYARDIRSSCGGGTDDSYRGASAAHVRALVRCVRG